MLAVRRMREASTGIARAGVVGGHRFAGFRRSRRRGPIIEDARVVESPRHLRGIGEAGMCGVGLRKIQNRHALAAFFGQQLSQTIGAEIPVEAGRKHRSVPQLVGSVGNVAIQHHLHRSAARKHYVLILLESSTAATPAAAPTPSPVIGWPAALPMSTPPIDPIPTSLPISPPLGIPAGAADLAFIGVNLALGAIGRSQAGVEIAAHAVGQG